MSGAPDCKSKQAAGSARQESHTLGDESQAVDRSTAASWTTAVPCNVQSLRNHEQEAERKVQARQKEHDKHAKVAEKRARGAHATEEVVSHIDTRLKSLKHGRSILETLDNSDIKYRYEFREGGLQKWPTITWHRDSGTV